MLKGGRTRSKHEEQGKTQRTFARWRSAPYAFVAAGVAAVAYFVAGKRTTLTVDVTLIVTLSLAFTVTMTAAAAKIWVDRRAKIDQREALDQLQIDWRQADEELTKARARVAYLEGRLAEIRDRDLELD